MLLRNCKSSSMMASQGPVKWLGSGWAMDKFAFKNCTSLLPSDQSSGWGKCFSSGWAIDKFASKTPSDCCQVTGQAAGAVAGQYVRLNNNRD